MISPLFSLDGRTALVTGAGSPTGIGFAAARILGELGARVVVTSTPDHVLQRSAKLLQIGLKARGSFGDLTNEAYVSSLVDQTICWFGGLDIVVTGWAMSTRRSFMAEKGREDCAKAQDCQSHQFQAKIANSP